KQKQAAVNADRLILLVTRRLREGGVVRSFIRAIGWQEEMIDCVDLEANNFQRSLDALISEIGEKYDGTDYHVNLSGGTKIMSIAAYDFFYPRDTNFYYATANQIYNFQTDKPDDIEVSISLDDYLTLYGIEVVGKAGLLKPREETLALFNEFRQKNFNRYKFAPLRDPKNQYTENIDKQYFGGIWFEEYCYHRLKKDLELPDDAIANGVKLSKGRAVDDTKNDNEFDIHFIKNNALNVVECKVGMQGYGEYKEKAAKETVNDALYKLSSTSSNYLLGIRVNAYIFTLHDMSKFPQSTINNFRERIKFLGLRGIVTSQDLCKPGSEYMDAPSIGKL
ncbi:DUF1887 family CARF protein, partial [Salmonella enterica]|nr:DUF1887 family CARF protein [Salmonella enterica]